jgi:hypothetical protein
MKSLVSVNGSQGIYVENVTVIDNWLFEVEYQGK